MFKINTKTLQEMVGKLSRCSGNRLLEITKYYELKIDGSGLSIKAYDGSNFIVVKDSVTKGEEICIIIKADQFAKLVQRTSVEKMTFELKESYLEVIGNGKYKVEILADEKFPTFSVDAKELVPVDSNVIRTVYTSNKASVSNTIADGVLTGYLFNGDKCVTADGIKVCVTPAKFIDDPILLTQDMVHLLGAVTADKMEIQATDDSILVWTPDVVIYGPQMEGIENYPEVLALCDQELPSVCELSKLSILNILERLTLFIDPFEKNAITLNFAKEGLEISTKKGSYEVLAYAKSKNFAEFSCMVNGLFLKELVGSVSTELFELHYGDEMLLKLVSNEVVQLLATTEGDE